MKIKQFTFSRDNKHCNGTGHFFDASDLELITDYYFNWKKLNQINHDQGFRRNNLSEILSEGLASALFGWARTNATNLIGCPSSSCDLVNTETGELIQLKACSTDRFSDPGPTSFGPQSEFDTLIFMHMDCETDTASFYKLDADEYKTWAVNRTQTIADQQAQGKRPRVTILPKVRQAKLTPFYVYKFSKED